MDISLFELLFAPNNAQNKSKPIKVEDFNFGWDMGKIWCLRQSLRWNSYDLCSPMVPAILLLKGSPSITEVQ